MAWPVSPLHLTFQMASTAWVSKTTHPERVVHGLRRLEAHHILLLLGHPAEAQRLAHREADDAPAALDCRQELLERSEARAVHGILSTQLKIKRAHAILTQDAPRSMPVSYTHLRAHET